ncbi:MAG: putative DNA-binding domain-containing protein [Rhodoferax sp.]|jgi:hypothetical protein|nr:putative DNA-binding domain-containing protein [Rhodoferax sp.]
MSSQGQFAQALLNVNVPIPAGLTTWNGSDPTDRFSVYRNNVLASLIGALADTYPVVQALVGEEFFRAMSKVFVQSTPPTSRLMAYYGIGFADFIDRFPPARSIAYLADVARLEMARVEACHAADARPIDSQCLQATLSDHGLLMSLRLTLHPSIRVRCSPYAIGSIWEAHLGTLKLDLLDTDQAESMLVFREGLEVAMLEVSNGQACFVAALQGGTTLLAAAGQACAIDQGFDLPLTLAMLMRWHLLTDLSYGDTPQ